MNLVNNEETLSIPSQVGTFAQLTIPSAALSDTSELIYAAVAAMLQMSGYKMNSGKHKEHGSPWRRLEASIKAAQAAPE